MLISAAPVLVVLLLGLLVLYLAVRGRLIRLDWQSPGSRTPRLKVVERLTLNPQHTLCLVSIPGRTLVLDLHPTGCQVLAEMGAEEVQSDGERNPRKGRSAGGVS